MLALPSDAKIVLDDLLLAREIETFLYREAEAIDSRQFEEWLEFFADDIRYWVPIRKNLPFDQRFSDTTGDHDNAWIDDNRMTLQARVYQILTKLHWAEEPLSRVSHLVSNVIVERGQDDAGHEVIVARSKILVHRSRMEEAGEMIVGKREDRIRRVDGQLRIFYRRILIDQATLSAKNLSFFL